MLLAMFDTGRDGDGSGPVTERFTAYRCGAHVLLEPLIAVVRCPVSQHIVDRGRAVNPHAERVVGYARIVRIRECHATNDAAIGRRYRIDCLGVIRIHDVIRRLRVLIRNTLLVVGIPLPPRVE